MNRVGNGVSPSRISTDIEGSLYVNFYGWNQSSRVDKIIFDPEIEDILPLDGAVGERVIISGRYFGNDGVGATVTFGGISAPIHSWSNDRIACDIPAGASKTVDVVVTSAKTYASTAFSYRVR